MIPTKPAGVIWSDGQWKAIFHEGENVLVNAGAGSGKTAVLTERILEKLKRGIHLEDLIVLTFTKAAASEMKERLRKNIKKSIKAGYSLKDELDYIDQANIQTFDSFALSLVKKYHYLLGVDRNISIGDNIVFITSKNKFLDEIMEKMYTSNNQDFTNFINTFTTKNDNSIKQYILKVYNSLELITNKEEYLKNYNNNFYNLDKVKQNLNSLISHINYEKDNIKIRIKNLKNNINDEDLLNHIDDIYDSLIPLFKSSTYEEVLKNIDITLPTIPRKADFEEKEIVNLVKKNIKDVLSSIKKYLSADNEQQLIDEVFSTKSNVNIILYIIKQLDNKIKEYKKSLNLYEFLDIAKLAIKLMKENEDVRLLYKNKINEILIDEYQDTSDIQEELISLFENNNVYMVGDMKQSIYRFRNANPDIFKAKYNGFKNKSLGCAIDLSQNFRSREEVLKNINEIFSQVMDLDLGGVNYNNGHSLIFGNRAYEVNKPNQNYNLDILTYNMEDFEDFNANEVEAFITGRTILRMIKDRFKVYDKNTSKYRDVLYSDFVILTSDKNQYDLYKKIFEYLKIPLVIHKDTPFVKSDEIYVIKNLLKVVYSLADNEYFKNNFKDSLISVLRSFILEIDDKLISKIYFDDIIEGLKLHCNDIYLKLINLSKNIRNASVREILSQIYYDFNIYDRLISLGNVEERENKLNYLLTKFNDLSLMGYTIKDCINYLEEVINNNLDIEYTTSANVSDDVVSAMSIHKSKGLEFSICFYLGLFSKFNLSELNDRILFDQEYGLILPVFDEGLKDTFYKTLLKLKVKKEEISERLRVLYVALTRAREKMIIVVPEFNKPVNYFKEQIPLADRLNYNSFYNIFMSLKYKLKSYISRAFLGERQISKDYEKKPKLSSIVSNNECDKIKLKEVHLKKQILDKARASMNVKSIKSKEEIDSLNFGTYIHKYLEIIDWSQDVFNQIDNFSISNNVKEKLKIFFNSDLIKNLDIENVYHEYEFKYQVDDTLIFGIVDLIIETNDYLIIIDYKLSDINKEEYITQINTYVNYLKTISSKTIIGYLYSILKSEFKKIN